MSVKVMAAVWALDLPGTEKLVLLALADWSNDEGNCWPSMAQLASKSGLTDRAVRSIIGRLVERGLLTRRETPGKGVDYSINPGTTFRPEEASPRKQTAKTPERRSANTLHTSGRPKKDKPSLVKRASKSATRYPENFAPVMSGKTASVVAGWPPGRLEDELEHFADHHTAKGTLSYDWQASWRTWVKFSKKWTPRHERTYDHRADRPSGWETALRTNHPGYA